MRPSASPQVGEAGLRARLLLALALFSGAAPSQAAAPTPATQPRAAYIAAVGHVPQTWNNCGPASVIEAMQAYGLTTDQVELGRYLRPGGGYMTAGVIDPYLRQYGLRAVRYRNGRIAHLRALIDLGIPVIVLQYMKEVGKVPHFRVVRGYDDRSGVIWMSDPIYGPNTYLDYRSFEALWTVYNEEFIPIFPAGWEKRVASAINSA